MSEHGELVLIRHGESTANASGVWQGRLDYPLSARGKEQARSAGKALAGKALAGTSRAPDVFYTSPLSRARETAEISAREAGFEGEVVCVDGLIERGGGAFEGSTWAERERTMPGVVEKFRSIGEDEGWRVIGAETDEEILARFVPAVSGIMGARPAGSRVAVVSHGGVMRAYLRHLFGPDILSGGRRAPNASITRIEWPEGDEPRLISLANTDHLPDILTTSKDEPTSE